MPLSVTVSVTVVVLTDGSMRSSVIVSVSVTVEVDAFAYLVEVTVDVGRLAVMVSVPSTRVTVAWSNLVSAGLNGERLRLTAVSVTVTRTVVVLAKPHAADVLVGITVEL